MSNSHYDPPARLPFQDRIPRVVTVLLGNERTKEAEVGLPGPAFADVAVDTLLALAADLAGPLIVPAEKADVRERQACAAWVHRGLAQACTAILAQEYSATEPRGLRTGSAAECLVRLPQKQPLAQQNTGGAFTTLQTFPVIYDR